MDVKEIRAKTIFTPQHYGFLAQGPYPYTHSCNPYVGCAYGNTTCGLFCYAQHMPNAPSGPWGQTVLIKANAPELVRRDLRADMRIFMSATSDVYQPVERQACVTLDILTAMAERPPNLLVVQTRGLLAERDFAIMASMRRAVLSITVETDDQARLTKGGPDPLKRLAMASRAVLAGVHTQVTVSPCLPYTPDFVDRLVDSGVRRFIVDTVIDGDGSKGVRTSQTSWAQTPGWDDRSKALALAEALKSRGVLVGWSIAGFNGIK